MRVVGGWVFDARVYMLRVDTLSVGDVRVWAWMGSVWVGGCISMHDKE